MKTLSIREVRNALGRIETLVNSSGELIITRRGEAIARILPIQGKHRRPSHHALHQLTSSIGLLSEQIIRADRDER